MSTLLLPTATTKLNAMSHSRLHRVLACYDDAPEQSLVVLSAGVIQMANGGYIGSSTKDASAIFQVDSTTQGFLPPRMTTTQRNAISSPTEGLTVYNTTTHQMEVRTNSAWVSSSILLWSEVTETTQSMSVNAGYIANNASVVVFTLPSTAAVGDVVRISGKGAGGWKLAQNASGIIHFGNTNTTTGVGGYIESTHRYNCVELVCTVANNEWVVLSSMGNVNIV